jgi:hypothetical protein
MAGGAPRTVALAIGVAALALASGAWLLLAPKGAPAQAPPLASSPAPHAPSADEPSAAPKGPVLDREKADRIRALMHAILAQASASAAPSAPPPPSAAPSFAVPRSATGRPLEPMPDPDAVGHAALRDYIRDRVREDLFPLARQCYETALERDPRLAGTAVVAFRIVGDEKVGGVVDESHIVGDDPKNTLVNPDFSECLVQSMMSVSFGAPPPGTRETTVHYPITFSPDPVDD